MCSTWLYGTRIAAITAILIGSGSAWSQGRNSAEERSSRLQQHTEGTASSAAGDRVPLPAAVERLDLDKQQREQLTKALKPHNVKLKEAWGKFHRAHMKAVELEAAWTAAVRDTLSEKDRRTFDQKQLQDREMTRYGGEDEARESERTREKTARAGESGGSTANRDDRNSERANRNRSANASANRGDSRESGEENRSRQTPDLVIITVRTPERFLTGLNQSDEQGKQCAEACQKYKQELRSAWKKVHRMHHELVRIEAERLQALENELTEEQLTKLREDRQEPKDTAETDENQRNR